MAEVQYDWNDIIANPTQFPDDMLIRDLGDVGKNLVALRQNVVPRSIASQEVRALREQQAQSMAQQRLLQEQLANALSQLPTQPQSTEPAGFDYQSDPILRPFDDRTRRHESILTEHEKLLRQINENQSKLLQGIAQIPVAMKLEQLRAQDETLDPQELVQFAAEKQRNPDITDFWKLKTFDKQMAKAREEGIQAGIEQAKRDALANPQVPFTPFGPPQVVSLPTPQFETIDAAENAAVLDPEISSLFYAQF